MKKGSTEPFFTSSTIELYDDCWAIENARSWPASEASILISASRHYPVPPS